MHEDIKHAIKRAAEHEIELSESDFKFIDGEPCLDGMVPNEWIDAMVMD